MKISVHRDDSFWDEESDYDSLWSDSEEEEFPVNPRVKREGDDDESPRTPSELGDDYDLLEEFSDRVRAIRETAKYASSIDGTFLVEVDAPSSDALTPRRLHQDFARKIKEIDTWEEDVMTKHMESLRLEGEKIEELKESCQSREQRMLAQWDGRISDILRRRRSRVDNLIAYKRHLEELERQRVEDEQRRREEEECKKKEQEAKRAAQEEALQKAKDEEAQQKREKAAKKLEEEEERQKSIRKVFTDWDAVNDEAMMWKRRIEDVKSGVLAPVSNNKELRSYCFRAKRKVKPLVGQLTNSMKKLMESKNEIEAILNEAQQFNPLVYQWLLNFFCKCIVSQAETETIVSPQSAVSIGMLAVLITAMHPDTYEFMMARFVKKCPQIIGYSCSIDTEEGRKRMGYRRNEQGKWEEDTQYSERISGMTSVWAIMTSARLSGSRVQHYPISLAWAFLARHVNRPVDQTRDADFAAVAAWWDMSAEKLITAYGRQGTKLLNLAWDDWTAAVANKRYPASVRLRLLGEDWKSSGKLVRTVSALTP